MLNRRELFKSAIAGSAVITMPSLLLAQKKDVLFELPRLPYAFDALEPHIDAKTMEIHHGRHHKAYVDNLNKLVAGSDWTAMSITEICTKIDMVPEKIRIGVRNNGGGHYNHTMFWQMMAAKGGKPSDTLAKAIETSFTSHDKMLEQLKTAAMTRFGSGWAWLSVDKEGKLKISSTANQDNPLMDGSGTPILGIDVWEHAYYLKYQNLRASYVDAFFKVINWEFVNELYAKAKKG